jgi:hypothetical protein
MSSMSIASIEVSHKMKSISRYGYLLLAALVLSCAGKKESATPKPPPPPIDENLLDLVPYESDLVVWLDIAKLRASAVWTLVEKVLGNKDMGIPLDESLRNPILKCDEMVMAYLENESLGSQLLIVAKGTEPHIAKLQTVFGQNEDAQSVPVEGFDGVRSSTVLLVPLTKRTVTFGNRAIVRMSAKVAAGKSRPVRANPYFEDFETGGPPAARLRYRSGVTADVIEKFKAVAPRINPGAVTGLDATIHTDAGFELQMDLSTQTQMDASVIAEDLRQAKDELKNNMIVLFLGVTWILDRVRVSSEKTEIHVDATLDARDIDELGHLVDRLQKIQELLNDSDGPPFKAPTTRDR